MRELTLDASATLINKTAVNFLIRDTADALTQITTDFQFFGEPYPSLRIDHVNANRLLANFRSMVNQCLLPSPRNSVSRRKPILYFDPVYVLFGDLQEKDFVVVHDMTTVTQPEWHSRNVSTLYQAAFRKILRSGCSTIHVSRSTMLSMRVSLGSEGRNPSVLHLYVRDLATSRGGVNYHPFCFSRYFLFVGNLEHRKNIGGLISAYALSDLQRLGIRLVIVGGHGHGGEEIRQLAESVEGTSLLGYVSDGDLHRLYQQAGAFVYPSYLEGFGLPLLEAMSYGLPCLAPTTGASPEVGGPAVMYVDPYDVPAIADALNELAVRVSRDGLSAGHDLRTRALTTFSFEAYMRGLTKILGVGE